jgi:hypothetical protein
MNPDIGGFEPETDLPRPKPVEAGRLLIERAPQEAPEKAERRSKQAERPGTAGPATQAPHLPIPGLLLQPPPIPTTGAAGTSPATSLPVAGVPPVAGDIDLIEKEWVIKAKAIVENTRDDPHLQNKEMSKFKADYIKKRYNKDIKVSEE